MTCLLIATLKSGDVLEVEFPDRATLDAELRLIERLRKYRWGLPTLAWRTTAGQRWVLGIYDLAGEFEVREAQPVEAVAS
jgi:hypothetical protein